MALGCFFRTTLASDVHKRINFKMYFARVLVGVWKPSWSCIGHFSGTSTEVKGIPWNSLNTLTIRESHHPKTVHCRLQEVPRSSQNRHRSPLTASETAQAASKKASGRFPEASWKHLERVLELERSESRPGSLQAWILVPLGLDLGCFCAFSCHFWMGAG